MYLDNLVGYWDMSTVDPVNLAPKTYGLHNGTGDGLVASTDIVNGVGGGKGIELNGTNKNVSVADSALLRYTASIPKTIFLFFKANDVVGYQTIFCKWGGANESEWLIALDTSTLTLAVNGEATEVTMAGVEAGRIYFAAFTLDTSGNSELFVDGDSQGIGSATSLQTVLTEPIFFGENQGTNNYNGMIDSAGMINAVLTQTQIIDLEWLIRTGRM